MDVSAFGNPTRKEDCGVVCTGQMTCSKSPPYTNFNIRLVCACSPGHPRTTFLLIGRYDNGKDSPHRRRQPCTIQRPSFFLHFQFLSPSQPMRRRRLLETRYQLNSVVALSWETSVWISLLIAPDRPMCFFSEPTSWIVYIHKQVVRTYVIVFTKTRHHTDAPVLFLSFYV